MLEQDIQQILFSQEELQARVQEIAQEIQRDYAGKEIMLISVLRGSCIFMADLCRAIDEAHACTEKPSVIVADTVKGVGIKLNPIRSAIEGKRIVLIDDSIVRGTTCRRTIELLRSAGAKEIHMRVSAPPFVAPCCYGTDVDSAGTLIANHHTVPEIASIIGADSLGYLSMEHAMLIAGDECRGFCAACFGGEYPAGKPAPGGKNRFEQRIHSK